MPKYLIVLLLSLGLCSSIAMAEDKPIFPEHRVVGYYGNFYSGHMGVLGEYPTDEMLGMLNKEVKKWEEADPHMPVIPAIEYIAVVAQNNPGHDEKYRLRMPDDQIDRAIALAAKINGIVVLDVQIGQSSVEAEVPRLEKYLSMPNVMLALDPEFSMVDGETPGSKIGTMDAKDINFAIHYLAELVKKKNLPPKFLVVHRFTQHMVTNYKEITPQPEVQVVMDMDGFGGQPLKKDSYHDYIATQPVEFTGIKLFYHQDRREEGAQLFTPQQIMNLKPVPVFILFQ